MEFVRELPTAQEIKRMYPLNEDLAAIKEQNDKEIAKVFKGESDKLILIIGPCSADREDAVVDYIKRLRKVQETAILRGYVDKRGNTHPNSVKKWQE